ncbi:MAG: hypothetical protein JSU07_03785 [Bacteroidetes bacterium]|nr:hypothetical protein [Bacteroidota bacterium]
MSCGSGCGTTNGGKPAGCNNNGSCGTLDSCNKLSVFDWLANMRLPDGQKEFDVFEIRFKNSRKDYYRNVNNLQLQTGDIVAVEATPGHDIGVVSLGGELVKLQLKKRQINADSPEIKKVYRKAKQSDIDKWREAQAIEHNTMHKARSIAIKLGLEMKLSDVEFQGDKSKATFYYTADARVDFRELIKVLAFEFGVRIEMRQVGARQEASRLGGIGSCGRELCCSTWLTDYRAVSTSAARYQQLSLNPLKLAGQCGKLKCCLNYELDSYLDALKQFPNLEGKIIKTKKGDMQLEKTDIFRELMWFSYKAEPGVIFPLPLNQVSEAVEANKRGELPNEFKTIQLENTKVEVENTAYENVVGQDDLTRFDHKRKQSNRNNRSNSHKGTKPKSTNQTKQTQANQSSQNTSSTKTKPNNKSNPNQPPKKHHHKPKPNNQQAKKENGTDKNNS